MLNTDQLAVVHEMMCWILTVPLVREQQTGGTRQQTGDRGQETADSKQKTADSN